MKKHLWLFIFNFLLPFFLTAQTFSLVSDTAVSYSGCIQLENVTSNKYAKEALQVFLLQPSTDRPTPPIVGNWIEEGTTIYFCPLIPFHADLTYQAQFTDLPNFTFQPTASKNSRPTELTHIYPSLTQLPENVLKLYFHFSAPMSEGNAYQYLALRKENGEKIESPFLELQPLLWNEDRTRLTVWFDPGRVKRELLRNQKLGAPLEEGNHYLLHISKEWKDINGFPLSENYTKKIEVIQADRSAPRPINWRIITPKANTREPIVLHFGESLDHALVSKSLTIHTQDGQQITGEIKLRNFEQEWRFFPATKWTADSYYFKIKGELEDLAGNNLNRLFDTNLELTQTPPTSKPYYYRYFTIE